MLGATIHSRLEDCRRIRVISQGAEPLAAQKPLSILVAADNPCDSLFLEQALFQAGLHVPTHFVDDGQETIAYLSGDPPFNNRVAHPLPTLLLLDLPQKSGLEVLHWLHRKPGLARILVVVLSDSAEYEHVCRAYALGADSYVRKPADAGELVSLATHLKNYWLEMCPV